MGIITRDDIKVGKYIRLKGCRYKISKVNLKNQTLTLTGPGPCRMDTVVTMSEVFIYARRAA